MYNLARNFCCFEGFFFFFTFQFFILRVVEIFAGNRVVSKDQLFFLLFFVLISNGMSYNHHLKMCALFLDLSVLLFVADSHKKHKRKRASSKEQKNQISYMSTAWAFNLRADLSLFLSLRVLGPEIGYLPSVHL